jgi:hypothetical protein
VGADRRTLESHPDHQRHTPAAARTDRERPDRPPRRPPRPLSQRPQPQTQAQPSRRAGGYQDAREPERAAQAPHGICRSARRCGQGGNPLTGRGCRGKAERRHGTRSPLRGRLHSGGFIHLDAHARLADPKPPRNRNPKRDPSKASKRRFSQMRSSCRQSNAPRVGSAPDSVRGRPLTAARAFQASGSVSGPTTCRCARQWRRGRSRPRI